MFDSDSMLRLAVVVATFVCVGVALLGEKRGQPLVRYCAKPLASAGFLVAAVLAGALDGGAYGRWVFGALALCALGDVLLLGRGKGPFLAGLVAFLLGHVGFVGAFVAVGLDWTTAAVALGITAAITGGIARWLLPQVQPSLAKPVLAYIVVITLMVAAAFGAQVTGPQAVWIPAAAVAFAASDISVALDRFAGAGFGNRAWGLPLYYAATLAFALTAG